MKKILILAVVAVLALTANAHDFTVDGIYYNILNSNEVAVTGKGNDAYQYIEEYYGDVTIPETVTYNGTTYSVTNIEGSAFISCSGLTSVVIPNSVTNIGDWAFWECTSLISIDIPNSVTTIGKDAFSCTAWYNNQPDGLIYTGKVAYKYKGTMPMGTNITLEEGTLGISGDAFRGCTGLTSIEIPNSVTNIGDWAFYNCSGLTSVVIPNSVTNIGGRAFYNCSGLTSVVIPNSVTNIGYGTFRECTSLISIDIPNSVTYIGEYAFFNCSGLTSIEISNSVTNIGDWAFCGCTGLTSIEISNSVTNIGNGAFYGCSGLSNTSISFPESVRSIGQDAFYNTYFSEISFEGDIDYLGNKAFDSYRRAGTLQLLAFYGNINNGIGNQAFWHHEGNSTAHAQRFINQLILGVEVDSIKGLNIEPGDEIYSYNPVPPVADEKTFLSYGSTVHVPASSLAAYFTAPYWCNFANIVGDAVVPEEVTIDKDSVEVNLGTQFNLTGSVIPANASHHNITWESSNATIATVDNGQVFAVGAGECDIIARCLNKKAICHVVVKDTTVTITLDQQEVMVLPNHIVTLFPSASPIMPDLAVSSSDPSVAAARLISGKVQVVGIKEGTTTITVGSTDGAAVPATCLVTVYTESGDVNCDGFIDINDVTGLIDYVLTGNIANLKVANADFNNDSFIDIDDITALIDRVLGK